MSIRKIKTGKIAQNGSESTILNVIRDFSPVSRSVISEKTALPVSAVSKLTSRLLERRVIIEEPLADTRGIRRKRGFCLNPAQGHVISVQYKSSSITLTAVDTAYNIIRQDTSSGDIRSLSKTARLQFLITETRNFFTAISSSGPCLGIVLVEPGVIDEDSGKVLMCSILDDWEDVPLREVFQENFSLPVTLVGDGLAAIRAVDMVETGQKAENLIYIQYGDGISCGMKLCGKYVYGKRKFAGELGHCTVTRQPIPCRCGATGCLEAVAALPALEKNARNSLAEISDSILSRQSSFTGIDVLLAAAKGDRLASRIVDEAFVYLGTAVSCLVNVLAPDLVIFEHSIGLAGPNAVTTLFQAVRKSVIPSHLVGIDMRVSTYNKNLSSFGGAVIAVDNLYCSSTRPGR
jgi:predicted NBD/HSP70 family sugar kinase